METIGESGGVVPHHPHHRHPIPGSGYFPSSKDSSATSAAAAASFFFPNPTTNPSPSSQSQSSVFHAYGGSSRQGADTTDVVQSLMYGGGQLQQQQAQRKGRERSDSEERAAVPAGVNSAGDRYHLTSSSTSHHQQHHHHRQQQQQQHHSLAASYHHRQHSPQRGGGLPQFMTSSPQNQHQQRMDAGVDKAPSGPTTKMADKNSMDAPSAPPPPRMDTHRTLSPEKRAGKDLGDFSPIKKNPNHSFDNTTSPYYNFNRQSLRQSALGGGFVNESNNSSSNISRRPGFDPSLYSSDIPRTSVKDVYEKFGQGRRGSKDDGNNRPAEALPVAYDENEIQTSLANNQQQQYREKLERSISQDAVAARTMLSHQDYPYEGADPHHRPRAITMNSMSAMFNRRDGPPNQNSLYANNHHHNNSKNQQELYHKMRDHFNNQQSNLNNMNSSNNNPYLYRNSNSSKEKEMLSPPISQSSSSSYNHNSSSNTGTGNTQRTPEARTPSRQDLVNQRLMMGYAGGGGGGGDKLYHKQQQQQQDIRAPSSFPGMNFSPPQQRMKQQSSQQQLPEKDQTSSPILPSSHQRSSSRGGGDHHNNLSSPKRSLEAVAAEEDKLLPSSSRKSPVAALSSSEGIPSTTTTPSQETKPHGDDTTSPPPPPRTHSSGPNDEPTNGAGASQWGSLSSPAGNPGNSGNSINQQKSPTPLSSSSTVILGGEEDTPESDSESANQHQDKDEDKDEDQQEGSTTTATTNLLTTTTTTSDDGCVGVVDGNGVVGSSPSSPSPKDGGDGGDANSDDTQNYSLNNGGTPPTSNGGSSSSAASPLFSPKAMMDSSSPPATPTTPTTPTSARQRKLSSLDDSPEDSLPDHLPRELLGRPKKELASSSLSFSDDEIERDEEDDSFHSGSAGGGGGGGGHYPPLTPPSPNSAGGGGGMGYPPSFQHRHQHQPFFPSPERAFPGQQHQHPHHPHHPQHHHPFGSPRSMLDAGGQGGIPPHGFSPFGKDMAGGRFPTMPGLGGHEMALGPPGGPSFMGPAGQMALKMGVDKDVYFCHLCSYSGKSKTDFDSHMAIHFEYNCPHCDYTSRTEGRLKRHIKDFHTDDSSRRSMPGRPKVFKCKQCSFSATEKDKFWEHARSHIKEDKLLQCPKCPFVTEYKHHLEYHLRNHFGSKPFKCNKCNYSCVNKSMLNSHMKSHTNVYQYRCSDCTYATKYCHSLKLHLRKYNHKPATVLNQDGSLPRGMDADTSGLSTTAKRGPPRGPRGPRKDKNDPYFNQMFGGGGGMPPTMAAMGGMTPAAMNPMLKGMMPFWPVMPPGLAGHPGMLPGLPGMPHQHMGGGMDMRGGIGGGPQPNDADTMSGGEESPLKDEDDSMLYLPCRLCDFIGDSTEALCLHLLQVHKDETGEMASMYGISETALAESMERAKRAKLDHHQAGQRMERRMSEMSNESVEHEMSDFRRRNTIAGLLSRERENSDFPMSMVAAGGGKDILMMNKPPPFWASPPFGRRVGGGMGDKPEVGGDRRFQDLCYVDDVTNDDGGSHDNNENDSGHHAGLDILQQMTLKFGGVLPPPPHNGRSKSLDVDAATTTRDAMGEVVDRIRRQRHPEDEERDDDGDEGKLSGGSPIKPHHHHPHHHHPHHLQGQKELSPLDLTNKPKSVSPPPMFSSPNSPTSTRRYENEFHAMMDEDDEGGSGGGRQHAWMEHQQQQQQSRGRGGGELDKLTENLTRKRQISELENSPTATMETSNNGSNGSVVVAEQSSSSIVPRKRSRKGKAYKLDTLCMKLQEQRSRSPHNYSDDLDSDNERNNAAMESFQRLQRYSKPDNQNDNNDDDGVERGSGEERMKISDDGKTDDNNIDVAVESGNKKETVGEEEHSKDDSGNANKVVTDGKADKMKNSVIVKKEKDDDIDDDNETIRVEPEPETVLEIRRRDIKTEVLEEEGQTEEFEGKTQSASNTKSADDDKVKDDGDDDLENFEKLQETLNNLNEKLKREKDAAEIRFDNDAKDDNVIVKEENKTDDDNDDDNKKKAVKEEDDVVVPTRRSEEEEKDNDNNGAVGGNNNYYDDDDDDDAKTEILGDDDGDVDDRDRVIETCEDLSDKENSADGFSIGGGGGVVGEEDGQRTETNVDLINTVIENRKKPLPPAVRRGTELAWKLLNDTVNPVTSIPIPSESPPLPEWKPRASSPIASSSTSYTPSIPQQLASHNNNNNNNVMMNSSLSPSPLKNGMRFGQPLQPPSSQSQLPPPPSFVNHHHHYQGLLPPPPPTSTTKPHTHHHPHHTLHHQHHHHLPIPLPPTPMALIPPTNRILPEHRLPLPYPPPPPTIPINKQQQQQQQHVISPKDNMYECTYCDLSFRDCVMYTVHMGYHSNRNPFKCNSCGIICRDKVEFFLHIARSPHS